MEVNRNTNTAAAAEATIDSIKKLLDAVGNDEELTQKLEAALAALTGKKTDDAEKEEEPEKKEAPSAAAEEEEEAEEDDADEDDADLNGGSIGITGRTRITSFQSGITGAESNAHTDAHHNRED